MANVRRAPAIARQITPVNAAAGASLVRCAYLRAAECFRQAFFSAATT